MSQGNLNTLRTNAGPPPYFEGRPTRKEMVSVSDLDGQIIRFVLNYYGLFVNVLLVGIFLISPRHLC